MAIRPPTIREPFFVGAPHAAPVFLRPGRRGERAFGGGVRVACPIFLPLVWCQAPFFQVPDTLSSPLFSRLDPPGIKHHRVRAIQAKLENSPFAACWKTELEKAGITAERLLQARA